MSAIQRETSPLNLHVTKLLILALAIGNTALARRHRKGWFVDGQDLAHESYILIVTEIKKEYPDDTLDTFFDATLSHPPTNSDKLHWLKCQLNKIMAKLVDKAFFRRVSVQGQQGKRKRQPKAHTGCSLETFAMSGQSTIYQDVRRAVAKLLRDPTLSRRQRQVLRLKLKLATVGKKGKTKLATNFAVAQAMALETSTIKHHWKEVLKRLREPTLYEPPTA